MAKIDLSRRKSGVRGNSTIPPNLDKIIPPCTPPQKPRKLQGKGSSIAPKTRLSNNLRDSFIADRARGTSGGNEHHRKQSSHDLSWTPRQTRDSVMDNMLQSLDQMYASDCPPRTAPPKPAQPHGPFDLGPYGPNRLRGHTFSSSISSDRSLRLQETSPKSSRGTRGHRSNSSSNFSSGLTRIDSVRTDSKIWDNNVRQDKEEPPSIREKLYESQRALAPEEKATAAAAAVETAASRSRSRKMSKGSNSSSLDFGQMIQEAPKSRSMQRRSSSFDLEEHRRRDAHPSAGGPVRAHFPLKRTQASGYHQLDAAPTPVIPSGPSRNNSPVRSNFPAPYPITTEPRTLLPRDKASKSASASRQRHGEKGEERVGKGRNSSRLAPSHSKSPSMDAAIPSTSAIGEKHRNVSESTTASTPASGHLKERPGFFRRVFGSSRSTITTVAEPGSLDESAAPPSVSNVRGSSRAATVSQSGAMPRPAKTATESSLPISEPREIKELPAIPLNKKSSFFRRRKKSVSGEPPMPMFPPHLEPPNFQEPVPREPHPSPVSSLRKVMDPYLSHALSAHPTRKGEVRENEGTRATPTFPQPNFVFAPRVDSLKRPVTVPNLPVERASSEHVEVNAASDVAQVVPAEEESIDATAPLGKTTSPPQERDHVPKSDDPIESRDHVHHTPDNDIDNVLCANDPALNLHPHDTQVAVDISVRPHRSRSATISTLPAATSGQPTSNEHDPLSRAESHGPPGDTMDSVRKGKGVFLEWDSPPVSVHSPPTREVSLSKNSSGRSARIYLQPTTSEDSVLKAQPARASLQLASNAAMGNCLSRAGAAMDKDFAVIKLVADLASSCTNPSDMPAYGEHDNEMDGTELCAVEHLTEEDSATKNFVSDPVAKEADAMTQLCEWLETLSEPTPEPKATFTDDEVNPSCEDHAFARRIFDGDATAVPEHKAAAWLMGKDMERVRVLKAFMELFGWKDMSVVTSLKSFCSRLYVRGETAAMDSLLRVFALRWCECNPNHGFKSVDVVHLLCFSIVLLNTDLHVLTGNTKMTRAEFVEGTKEALLGEAANQADAMTGSPMTSAEPSRSNSIPTEFQLVPPQPEVNRKKNRSSFMPSDQDAMLSLANTADGATSNHGFKKEPSSLGKAPLDEDAIVPVTAAAGRGPKEDPGPLVKTLYVGSQSGWELQLEKVLKATYESIRKNRLPMHGSVDQGNSGTFTNKASNLLRRTPSLLSKANSENQVTRARPGENVSRFGTARWHNKNRTRPRLNNAISGSGPSGRSSFDNDSSAMPSPSGNSTWTKHSVNRTANSISVESFATAQTESKLSVGFTGALSQAIIREESSMNAGTSTTGTVNNDNSRPIPLLEDESLQLVGAPWAKEGLLKYRHYLETTDKKIRNKDWVECFAVVEKGWVRLFSFPSTSSRSLRHRFGRSNRPAPGGVVGGGNWMDNAESIGNFMLRHTIAGVVPSGFSDSKPNVWALSMATGGVHMFACGTPEIVHEFVTTANYWAARLSKEPLQGGVSNIEYGWSKKVIDPLYLLPAPAPSASEPSSPVLGTLSTAGSADSRMGSLSQGALPARPSMQSSVRGSHDHNIAPVRIRLAGDRAMIAEWAPPQASMMGSRLLEVDQLRQIRAYLANVEADLRQHTRVKLGIEKAYSPRSANEAKALKNWARKDAYLTAEQKKFTEYVNALVAAQAAKEALEVERALRASQVSAV